jgi:hypothetical protein
MVCSSARWTLNCGTRRTRPQRPDTGSTSVDIPPRNLARPSGGSKLTSSNGSKGNSRPRRVSAAAGSPTESFFSARRFDRARPSPPRVATRRLAGSQSVWYGCTSGAASRSFEATPLYVLQSRLENAAPPQVFIARSVRATGHRAALPRRARAESWPPRSITSRTWSARRSHQALCYNPRNAF